MALSSAFMQDLERLGPLLRDEPMARHTTMHLGGPAEAYVAVHDCTRLTAVLRLAARAEVTPFIMGGGSNLLVSDAGLPGLVVETWSNLDALALHPPAPDPDVPGRFRLHSFCGVPLPRLAHQTAKAGFTGMEWAAGIPGTVGGGLVNNAGAHGGCMADCVIDALVFMDGEERVITGADLGFSYRHSHLRGSWSERRPPVVVLAATLGLRAAAPADAERRVQECLNYRRNTQPSQRSVGSIFKNPPGDAAGRLIEQAGLKGTRSGDAEISPVHANFIVNRGNATAADVNALVALVQSRVRDAFGTELELEIQRVGVHHG